MALTDMKRLRLTLLWQICITHLVSHMHMLVLPVLMPVMLLAHDDISFIEFGLAISVFNIVSALIQAPVGFFVDRIGPKRVLIGGLMLGSLSFLSLGFFHHYYWLVIAMAIAGVANAVYHPADYAILSRNITEGRMGRAFSLHTFSGYLGFAITPTLMLFVADYISINAAFMVSGLIGLLAVIILLPKAREDIAKQKNAKQQTDLVKQDDSAQSTVAQASEKSKVSANIQPTSVKIPLITPAIFLMLVLFFLLSLSGGSIQNFSVSALVTGYNVSLTDANVALTAFLVFGAVGVLVGGHLADYTERHGLIAASALVVTAVIALLLALLNISSMLIITVLIGLMGFLSGIIAPSRDMLVRSVAPKGAEGRVFGIVSTGFNFGGTAGPIIFGWILDNDYPHAIFGCTAIFMALTAVIAIYQEMKGVKHQTNK